MNVKKRSNNFSASEESVLLSLVKVYKSQIECKKTDTNTNEIKKMAWINVTKQFNSTCGDPYREYNVLKNKYENMKKRTKRNYADHKKYTKGTGGGPEKEIVITTADNDILEILGSQLTGQNSEFDDDALNGSVTETLLVIDDNVTVEDSIEEECNLKKPIPVDEAAESSNDVVEGRNWAKYTPAMLRNPISTPLKHSGGTDTPKIKRQKTLGYKLEEWAAEKLKLTSLQWSCFLEEHNLKMQQMKEKHEQYLLLQKNESDARIKLLNIEHCKKMEITDINNTI